AARGARGGSQGKRGGLRATRRQTATGGADVDEYDEDCEENDDEEDLQEHKQGAGRHGHSKDNDDDDDDDEYGGGGGELDMMEDDVDDFPRTAGPAYERYFQDLHTTKGSKTSDNTLSKLPPLTQAECRGILSKVPIKHKDELELLEKLHRNQFRQWCFELACGFNLVFYGYGSKRRLINSFAAEVATDAPAAIVNGYFPALNFKHSLEKIVSEIIGFGDTSGSVADLASLIHGYFESGSRKVDKMYLVVHNIDGPCLRKHQGALAVLAECKNIHMMASVDHIEAPLIWDSSMITKFNWTWHDLTTFEPYTVETSYENFASSTTEIGPRGVLHVLASLTENAKSIFRILAEHQIAESVMDEGEASGQKSGSRPAEMAYNSYFAACRDQFLVSSEMAFRSQLTEFRDHKVIQSRHAADGTEFVHIPLDANTLGTILEGMD
ncbi:Origin recognition complex subunit 2, partial [Dipsacomyces acuminosporus]